LAAIELLTLSALFFKASNFVRPVMVGSDLQNVNKEAHFDQIISGGFDFSICGGDCKGVLSQVQRRDSSRPRHTFKQLSALVLDIALTSTITQQELMA
jgi:hypothetical protein